jgi:glycosyltransferase involved in cell wall biosynthesis
MEPLQMALIRMLQYSTNKTVRIIYTIYQLANFGGMERILTEKANYLSDYYDITIITVCNKGSFAYRLSNKIKTIDLNIDYSTESKIKFLKRILVNLKQKKLHRKKMQKIVDDIRPDLIITLGDGDIDIIPKLRTSAKVIWETHFCRYYQVYDARYNNKPLLIRLIKYSRYFTAKYYAKKYNVLVVLTKEDNNYWKLKNSVVIPNFITGNINSVSELKGKIAVSVGRLEVQKGYDILIDIWNKVHNQFPDWSLFIYGEGNERKKLENKIKDLHLNDSIFLKGIERDIENSYKNASIFLSSSRYEGMPLVMLEAMSTGLPVISFDYKCGPKDILLNGSGIIVKSFNLPAFSDAIIKLIENESLRKTMGLNAKMESLKYKKNIIMDKWVRLIENNISIS